MNRLDGENMAPSRNIEIAPCPGKQQSNNETPKTEEK